MTDLINTIVQLEWTMFHSTKNVGGPASCQNDRPQFEIMRQAQFLCWPKSALEAYRDDLVRAAEQGQNLVSFKYAYMMELTAPEEYARIKPLLPAVSEEKAAMVRRLSQLTMAWAEAFAAAYPNLASLGRPIHASEDRLGFVSIETYSRGEWLTYSEQTLRLLTGHYENALQEGRNLQLEVLAQELRLSGLGSADQVEQHLARQREGQVAL